MTTDDTTTTAAPGAMLAAHVRGYAQAVRLHLADLGPEVTEDLTGGLEADLTEALADAAPATVRDEQPQDDVVLDLTASFGPAEAYAAELRRAAGLPPAGPARRRRPGLRPATAAWWSRSRARWAGRMEPLTSTPQWASLRTLGHELAPVWWVARGWLIGALLVMWFARGSLSLVPTSGGHFLVMAGAALVSVQWARGRWLPRQWLPRAGLAATALGVLLVPFAVDATSSNTWGGGEYVGTYEAGYEDAMNQVQYHSEAVAYGGVPGDDGVWVDGMQVSNLFAFDAQGDPIKDVQLYDDRGRPVRTVSEAGAEQVWEVPQTEGPWYFRPATAADGRDRWNVYPLRALPETGVEWGDEGMEPVVGVQPERMPWPFLKAPVTIEPDGGTPAEPDVTDTDQGATDSEPDGADGDPSPGPAPSDDGSGPADDDATNAPPSDTEGTRLPSPEPSSTSGPTTVLDASPQR